MASGCLQVDRSSVLSDSRNQEIQAYSIWGSLEGAFPESAGAPLQDLVSNISRTFGLPRFVPHITLLGGLRRAPLELLEQRCEQVAKAYAPVEVRLNNLEVGSTFYQFVYLIPAATSCQRLAKLHNALQLAFNVEPPQKGSLLTSRSAGASIESYMPHVSLAYGTEPPTSAATVKKFVLDTELFQAVTPELQRSQKEATSLGPLDASSVSRDVSTSLQWQHPFQQPFMVSNIVLMDTDLSGPVEQWQPIRVFPLSGVL